MVITLNSPHTIVLAEAKTKTITTLTIVRTVDLPQQKIVKAFVQEINTPIVLWEGATYDSIGQWTDTDVEARLEAIYGATASA